MRKLYQTHWHEIQFSSFAQLDGSKIAGPDFYAAFYREFFRRYRSWDEVDAGWLAGKKKAAQLVRSRIGKDERVLSLGSGIGIIEKTLLELGVGQLEIQDTTREPLRWVLPLFKPDHVHIGIAPVCLPSNRRYDLILMSAMDYCFGDSEWLSFLGSLRARLTPGGRALVVCASTDLDPSGIAARFWAALKDQAKAVLDTMRLRERGQFWGYSRTPEDHWRCMVAAGLTHIQGGEILPGVFWTEGRVS